MREKAKLVREKVKSKLSEQREREREEERLLEEDEERFQREKEKKDSEERDRRLEEQSKNKWFGLDPSTVPEEPEEQPVEELHKEPVEEPREKEKKEEQEEEKEKPKSLRREKPRLLRRRLLPLALPSNPVCNDLIAKFTDELFHAQKKATGVGLLPDPDIVELEKTAYHGFGKALYEKITQDEKKKERFKARQEVVKQFRDGVLGFYHQYLKKFYNSELTSKKLWEPPKWLLQLSFWIRLEKGRFKDVYGYFVENVHPSTHEDTQALIKQVGGTCWKGGKLPEDGKDRQDVILKKIDWKKMSTELEMSESNLKRYPPAFALAGILKPEPQKLEHGEIVYSIGYQGGYWNEKEKEWGPSKVRLFLKEDKAIIEGLRKMKLPR